MNVRFRTSFHAPADDAPPPGGDVTPAPPPNDAPAPPPGNAPSPPAPPPGNPPPNDPPPAPPPPPDKAEWRTRALTEVFGEEKDGDAPETKAEREKMAKLAGRYNTMGDALKALREAQRKISSGEVKAPLAKDATPEQVAAWRKDNGIPETPDKYDLGLPDGTVLGDSDKKIVTAWVAKVHGANASPDVVKAGTAAYLAIRDEMALEVAERNAEAKQNVAATLGAEWGADYKANVAGVDSLLDQADSDVVEALVGARGSDGIQLLNNPKVMKWFAGHARELGFVGATVVTQGGDLGKSIDDELASIKKTMYLESGERNPDYWKNEKAQERYRELLGAKERRGKK
jgi:hypothetical protein